MCTEKDWNSKQANVNSDYGPGGGKKDDFYFHMYASLYFPNVL